MKLVFATNNQNKLQEVQAMLPEFKLITLKDINCLEDIPETSPTISGNAIQKINYVTQYYSADGFADGTNVVALGPASRAVASMAWPLVAMPRLD